MRTLFCGYECTFSGAQRDADERGAIDDDVLMLRGSLKQKDFF
jgi:hypothetical protein